MKFLSSTEWNIKDSNVKFSPNYYFDISSNIKFKIKALRSYNKEIRTWPHSRSYEGIKTLAKYRGMQIGTKYAGIFI